MSLTLLTTRSDIHVVKTGEGVKKITLLQSRFDGEGHVEDEWRILTGEIKCKN